MSLRYLRSTPISISRRAFAKRTFTSTVLARCPPNTKNVVTEKLFQSPSKYIQGPSAIKNAPIYLGSLGKTALLTADDVVYKIGSSFWKRSMGPTLIILHSWRCADEFIGAGRYEGGIRPLQR